MIMMNVLHDGKGLFEQDSILFITSALCCIVQICEFAATIYDATYQILTYS